MKTPVTKPAAKRINWTAVPDPLTEADVKIPLIWTAAARTTAAIERQARLLGFVTPDAYLHQVIAAVIAGNEEDTARIHRAIQLGHSVLRRHLSRPEYNGKRHHSLSRMDSDSSNICRARRSGHQQAVCFVQEMGMTVSVV